MGYQPIEEGVYALKKVLLVMVIMFLLVAWPFGGIWEILLKPLIGGGVEQTYLYPIYGGIIILSGIIVGCTIIIVEKIDSIKSETKAE